MKIRNGFVSNSSSSSFMIVGVKRKGSYEDMEDQVLPKGIETLYTESEDCDYITGIVLADVSSEGDYLEDKTISFTELNEMSIKVAEALKVDIGEVSLIMGTRPS